MARQAGKSTRSGMSAKQEKKSVKWNAPVQTERLFFADETLRPDLQTDVVGYSTRSKGPISVQGSNLAIKPHVERDPVLHKQASEPLTDHTESSKLTPKESKQATIQIELIPYSQVRNPDPVPTSVLYVDTDQLEMDEFGIPTCRLSNILPLAAELESPIKKHSVKMWKLDGSRNPVSIGRGDEATNPNINIRTIAKHRVVDTQQLKLEQPANRYPFLSGVRLFWADDNDQNHVTNLPTATPLTPASPTSHVESHQGLVDSQPVQLARDEDTTDLGTLTLKAAAKRGKKRDTKQLSSTNESRIKWIRHYFGLDDEGLPGKIPCPTERDALDRHLKIEEMERTVYDEWLNHIPRHAPKDIALTQITRENLYKAFGFGKTTWFELHKRWSKDSSETGLQGARTILAWTEDPDALLPENSSRRRLFKAIGNLPFGDLPSQAILDRRTGRLNIVQGP